MALHNKTGEIGEELAKAFLINKGYEILATNWRFKKAEVDIIASFQGLIIFIEVKTRTNTAFGQPEDFVSKKKKQLFALAAGEFFHQNELDGEMRFDIIAIVLKKGKDPAIKHIEDAFFPYNF